LRLHNTTVSEETEEAMRFFRNMPVKKKLTIVIMLPSLLILLFGSSVFFIRDMASFRHQQSQQLTTLAKLLGSSCTPALLRQNHREAVKILGGLGSKPNILFAGLYDETGQLFAHYQRADRIGLPSPPPERRSGTYSEQGNLLIFETLSGPDHPLGRIFLRYDLSYGRSLRQYATIFGIILALAIGAAFILAWRLQFLLSAPIANLTEVAEEIFQKNDYSLRAQKYSDDELGVFASRFNAMLAQIEIQAADRRQYSERLEEKVAQRTAELKRINQNLRQEISERKRQAKERRKLEAQFQQTQKLESLGVLAGGIAHDFNNLLMVILGNTDLALLELEEEQMVYDNVKDIKTAALRATELAKQMLAYSGHGKFVIQSTNLNEIVESMSQLLRSSIGRKTELKTRFAPDLPHIQADTTQLHQIIMNLITNASEAIGDNSGSINVTTGAQYCSQEDLAKTWLNEELPAGTYVYLQVTDTGSGMDKETLIKIFDPFFTTKFTGRGLGLAAVLGIVRGHHGALTVTSRPGQGTQFTVYFPASHQASPPPSPTRQPAPWQSEGTILLVDDVRAVRTVAGKMLQHLGFTVIMARDGQEALEKYRANGADITAVLLDMKMPHMSGPEVFREIRRINPEACVILSSGHKKMDATSTLTGEGLAGFIQKPYRINTLQSTLNNILNPAEKL
jgi:signal transduction histidine kinase/ActR/RegA family two-component response regulator